MTYTEEVKQELSRKVAEKFGLANYLHRIYPNGSNNHLWLHDDWHTIMELCVKHDVYAYHDEYVNEQKTDTYKLATAQSYIADKSFDVPYSDCNEDPSEAERIARLLALGEVKI